jgi:hypothetical protein
MSFLYQPITWGFFLVFLPVLIHLINLMRQRRVKWGAMEFLRAAYRRHRRWIWLKQFLLLAARGLALGLLVAMLAHPIARDRWTQIFGGQTTHHIVLLDDSYSMSDQAGSISAFDRANQVITQLVGQVKRQDSLQKFTLVRFSRTVQANSSPSPADETASTASRPEMVADLEGVPVDKGFDDLLAERRRDHAVSALAVGPGPALAWTSQFIEQLANERPVVYLLSDMRATTWADPADILSQIRKLEQSGAAVNLIRCADSEHPNLSITDLQADRGTRAAGVPLFVNVTVKNFGDEPALQVPVAIQTTTYPGDEGSGGNGQSIVADLPAVLIERIEPRASAAQRVQVFFSTAGEHVVRASLPADAVELDNQRFCVMEIPADVPVLVVDGDPEQRNARYLEYLFQPGRRVLTGVRPATEPISFLRDAPTLDPFHALYLLDIPRLDPQAMANVEQYVRNGGGVAFFLGPQTDLQFLREWWNSDRGLFPLPVERVDELMPLREGSPGLIVEQHPVFRVLSGQRNTFAEQIRFSHYVSAATNWKPTGSARVLARLHNAAPLVVEKRFGDGRVVAILSTLAPTWNTWAVQPTFVVVMLDLQAYLDSRQAPTTPHLVGTPIEFELPADKYQPEVEFLVPGGERPRRTLLHPVPPPPDGQLGGSYRILGKTETAGIHEGILRELTGGVRTRRVAVNVDPREGDLATIKPRTLAESLGSTSAQLYSAGDATFMDQTDGGTPWTQVLLLGLVGLLVGEQLLACSASYHPARGGKP